MAHNRIYFASQKAGIAPLGSKAFQTLHGVQTLGMTTSFNLEQVTEVGQLETYENIETLPEVEMTIEKVLDGYPPVYCLATQLGTKATVSGRSAARCDVGVAIYDETSNSATGSPITEVHCSGMYVGSVSYTVPVDGNATESVSLVGNDKQWVSHGAETAGTWNDGTHPDGASSIAGNSDRPYSISGSGGVNRREDVLFIYNQTLGIGRDVNGAVSGIGTVLPREIQGISTSGTNDKVLGAYQAHVQSISVSTDFGRENLFELGRKGPYFKYVNFPIEVTTEITAIATSGDIISASEEGMFSEGGSCGRYNLKDQTIRLHMCEGLQLNMGKKNKLSTASITGGDAGGGNVEVTYTYTNQNSLAVYHPQDPKWSSDTDFNPYSPNKF